MGLGLLASRVLRSSKFLSTPKSSPFRRTITLTPKLNKLDAATAQSTSPEPDLPPPPRTPLAGARVHFPNPDDAIEIFVDGYPVKIPKGFTVLQACEVAGVEIP